MVIGHSISVYEQLLFDPLIMDELEERAALGKPRRSAIWDAAFAGFRRESGCH